nr:PREDICTED: peroxisome assembly protein 12 isoform X2 [Megachile rotundata]
MAEKGAYLTGTAFIRPSIFEIIAQESFGSTTEPAFKKLLSFIVSFNPGRYKDILKWADECYLLFDIILQRYYLKKYSTENSKLKRELSKKQKGLSLVLIVLFPYLRSKFSQLSQRYKLEELDGYIPQTKWEKLYRAFIVKGYSITFMIYEFMVLYNYILYISGKSPFTSPLLRLLSISLTYAEPKLVMSVSDLLRKIKNNSFGISDGIDIFQRVVTTSLEFGAFFLQFLSWWNQEHYLTNLMSLPIPPPPVIPETAKKYKGICPICCKTLRVHTVLPVSGYAFCYQCILSVIRKSGKCPVTNYPAKEDDLIRLYLD